MSYKSYVISKRFIFGFFITSKFLRFLFGEPLLLMVRVLEMHIRQCINVAVWNKKVWNWCAILMPWVLFTEIDISRATHRENYRQALHFAFKPWGFLNIPIFSKSQNIPNPNPC